MVEDVRLQGLEDGVKHFMSLAHSLIVNDYKSKTQGNLRQDGDQVMTDYLLAKANRAIAWGRFCGLNAIDSYVRGIKKGELWIHAASTGEGKTTFALNWCYNQVTRYKANVLYISLEMPYEQLRDKIFAIHSTHPKFSHYGKGLDYEKIKYGLLDETEEKWFAEVAKDFGKSVVRSGDEYDPTTDYGAFHVWAPDADVTMDDIKVHAEMKHMEEELHMLVVDHGGLVEARKKKRNKDATIELNSVLRDAKRLSLHFNHGEKIPVLLLFQINREGKEYADKNEGRYRLKSLAQANEAERSADVVTTSYLNDEHRAAGTMFFDNLKRRDGQHFPPFTAAIYWPSGRLGNLDPFTSGTNATGKGMSLEDMRNVDAILNEI
jgi:replicative DNA helicase